MVAFPSSNHQRESFTHWQAVTVQVYTCYSNELVLHIWKEKHRECSIILANLDFRVPVAFLEHTQLD